MKYLSGTFLSRKNMQPQYTYCKVVEKKQLKI